MPPPLMNQRRELPGSGGKMAAGRPQEGQDQSLHGGGFQAYIQLKGVVQRQVNTTIQSQPFIRSKQDGCSDKTET